MGTHTSTETPGNLAARLTEVSVRCQHLADDLTAAGDARSRAAGLWALVKAGARQRVGLRADLDLLGRHYALAEDYCSGLEAERDDLAARLHEGDAECERQAEEIEKLRTALAHHRNPAA